jgi:hypothetical protein
MGLTIMCGIDSEEDGNVSSECQKGEGTDCEDGDRDTDWKRLTESHMLCVLSVWNEQ